LANTLIYVRLIRVRNRVVYAVNCPFCEKAMDQSSLSGTRHEPRELRYKCMDGHRVSLVPTRNGASMGWK
jgi:lysyl-tRNA synthetase class I